MIGGSRLVYSFGRDGLMPQAFAKLDSRGLPFNATVVLTVLGVILGAVFPVGMLANLVSAGTLIAFIVASVGILKLRKREDIDHSGYKMPWYPVLPIISALASLGLFFSLNKDALILALGWVVIGAIVYVLYGAKHSNKG
jgi:APA family basic amino acid/polyamine antiporter